MNNYNINLEDKELEKLLDSDKNTLMKTYEDSFTTMESTLELIIKGIKHADFNQFKDTKLVWNIAGYINIIAYDMKIIVRDMSYSRNEWEKRAYARHACLIMYESMDDLLKLLGRDFKNIGKKINLLEFDDSLNDIRLRLNEFKELNKLNLKTIRNTATAHRDKDVLVQIQTILGISWCEILMLAIKFNDIVNDLAGIIMAIINLLLVESEEMKKKI